MNSFTIVLRLCDDDGVVRKGRLWHGADYPCTGSAHFGGEHILCDNRLHAEDPRCWEAAGAFILGVGEFTPTPSPEAGERRDCEDGA